MEHYSLLREFADSWMLVMMTLVFMGVVFWAFRPGSRASHDAAASSIFRNEDKPASAGAGGNDRHAPGATFKEARK